MNDTSANDNAIPDTGASQDEARLHIWSQWQSGNTDFDVANYLFEQKLCWIESVKVLRSMRGCSIDEADFELASDIKWRRFAVRSANSDKKCRLRVWQHMKHYGDKALFGYENDMVFDRIGSAEQAT